MIPQLLGRRAVPGKLLARPPRSVRRLLLHYIFVLLLLATEGKGSLTWGSSCSIHICRFCRCLWTGSPTVCPPVYRPGLWGLHWSALRVSWICTQCTTTRHKDLHFWHWAHYQQNHYYYVIFIHASTISYLSILFHRYRWSKVVQHGWFLSVGYICKLIEFDGFRWNMRNGLLRGLIGKWRLLLWVREIS